jgi:transposase
VKLETSTLSGWVGATAAALQPLIDALAGQVMASDTLHVDDTPVPVLAPGTGKTKTGRLWTYVRDERSFAGFRPPAALFFCSPDRRGEHPRVHLKDFCGVIHADGYAGFKELFVGGRITEAGCWGHPWTAPASAREIRHLRRSRSCAAIHSALRRVAPAAGPDDIRSSVPYHGCGTSRPTAPAGSTELGKT